MCFYLNYKDYIGRYEYSNEDKVYHGKIINISDDIITFEADKIEDIEKEFNAAVDEYEEMLVFLNRSKK